MNWTPHRAIAESLVTLRAATRSVGGSFRVLGEPMAAENLRNLIRDTLGIGDDLEHAADVAARIAATVGAPVTVPDALADALTQATVARDDVDLARHMGVDPLRLLMLGHDSIATVSADRARIRSVPLWRDRRLERLDVAFTLGKGVTWRNGTLRSTNTQLPHTMLDSMRGRTLDGIVEHGWDGWERLRVERASQSGNTLVLQTAPQERTTLSGI